MTFKKKHMKSQDQEEVEAVVAVVAIEAIGAIGASRKSRRKRRHCESYGVSRHRESRRNSESRMNCMNFPSEP